MACASTTFSKRESGVLDMDVMPVSLDEDTVREPNGRQQVSAVHPPAWSRLNAAIIGYFLFLRGNMAENVKLALLIDAENISPKYTKTIFDELSKYGVVTTKRIYGDWTKQSSACWKPYISENALLTVQQFHNTSNKNSSDATLIIDAMDILYSKNIDGFCIVSSDSDFTRLIMRIREDGKIVYGMGEKKSPKALINACDKFIYLDVNEKKEAKGGKKAQAKTEKRQMDLLGELGKEKIDALIATVADHEEDWVNLSEVGNRMTKLFPDFDQRNYGYKKLSDLIKALDIFVVKVERVNDNGAKTYLLKIKENEKQD